MTQGRVFRPLTLAAALAVPTLLVALLVMLAWHSRLSISRFGLRFLTSEVWDPVQQNFGALSSLYGSAVTTAIAMSLALPLGLIIALFLVELAPRWLGTVLGSAVELLAAVPSIIYGMWGLFVFAPWMAKHVQPWLGEHLGFLPLFQGPPLGIGILTAGIILALMVLPYITAVARDVFRMMPPMLTESAYGLGATTMEVVKGVTLRYTLPALVGAAFLGLGRALGETMAVTFVIGNDHRVTASLLGSGNSIASALANEFTEASEAIYLSALVELALILLLVSLVFQLAAQVWLKRLRWGKST